MRVRVFAPPIFNLDALDDDGWVDVPSGGRLRDVYRVLKVPAPLRPLVITTVNYHRARGGHLLSDGDVVSIFWPMSGG